VWWETGWAFRMSYLLDRITKDDVGACVKRSSMASGFCKVSSLALVYPGLYRRPDGPATGGGQQRSLVAGGAGLGRPRQSCEWISPLPDVRDM
jgi:hypothetical protein